MLAISGQVPSKVLGRGAFQDVDLTAAFADVATVLEDRAPRDSDHAELMTLALQARARRARRHATSCCPTRCRCCRRPDGHARRRRPAGWPTSQIAPPAARARRRGRAARRRAQRPGHRGRPRRPLRHGRRHRARRGARRAGAHDVQGQGSDLRPPSARRAACSAAAARRSRQLADERVRPAGRVRRVVLATTPASPPYKPIVQVDSDPMALGRFHPVTVPVLGHVGVTARAAARARRARRRRSRRPAGRRRRALGDLAGGEGAPARRRPRSRRRLGGGVRRADPSSCPTTRSSRSTSATTRTRSAATSSARRQSVLMSGYLGSIGFGFPAAMGAWAAAPDRPIVAVTGDGGFGQYLAELDDRGEVRHARSPTCCSTTAQLGKITKEQRAGRLGRVADRRCTTRTSPSTHGCAARSASG